MLDAVLLLAAAVADALCPRWALLGEITLLRHQLTVLQRSVARPRVTRLDRIALVALATITPTWGNVLHVDRRPADPTVRAPTPRHVLALAEPVGTGTRPTTALDVAPGKVIGECYLLKRAVEFRRFLSVIDRRVPQEPAVHVVVDNFSIHGSPPIRRLARISSALLVRTSGLGYAVVHLTWSGRRENSPEWLR